MNSQHNRWLNIMKAVPFEEKRLMKWTPPYICQPKFDGVRCRVISLSDSSSNHILVSSRENVIYGVPHLNQIFDKLMLAAELDGELYCHGMSFEQIVSITSRTVNLHADYQKIQFHLFDIVNDQPQMRRQLLIEALRGLNPWIQVAPFWLCENLDDVMRAYDSLIELGYEGIIVRHHMAPYERKRSIYVMKFKPKKEDEYEIVGYQEEISINGTPKESLGAIICRSGDGNDFSIGTGFSQEQRKEMWRNKEYLINRTAKVKYQHLTNGKQVPRFPVFVEISK